MVFHYKFNSIKEEHVVRHVVRLAKDGHVAIEPALECPHLMPTIKMKGKKTFLILEFTTGYGEKATKTNIEIKKTIKKQ